jgi:hypothetical protein
MLNAYSDRERELLALPVPWLGLPALDMRDSRAICLRAFELDYPDELCTRGEKSLEALMKLLGAIESTPAERLKLIRVRKEHYDE